MKKKRAVKPCVTSNGRKRLPPSYKRRNVTNTSALSVLLTCKESEESETVAIQASPSLEMGIPFNGRIIPTNALSKWSKTSLVSLSRRLRINKYKPGGDVPPPIYREMSKMTIIEHLVKWYGVKYTR